MANMRQIFIFLAAIILIWACSTQKKAVEVEKTKPVAKVDSVEYDIEMFDSKFETWYLTNKKSSVNRSLQYYENWNKKYVVAWNHKSIEMGKGSFFAPIVGYHSREEYGFELNHKLFYYFQYVENVLNIQIMPNGPKVVADN
jgi:hypothetical protein